MMLTPRLLWDEIPLGLCQLGGVIYNSEASERSLKIGINDHDLELRGIHAFSGGVEGRLRVPIVVTMYRIRATLSAPHRHEIFNNKGTLDPKTWIQRLPDDRHSDAHALLREALNTHPSWGLADSSFRYMMETLTALCERPLTYAVNEADSRRVLEVAGKRARWNPAGWDADQLEIARPEYRAK